MGQYSYLSKFSETDLAFELGGKFIESAPNAPVFLCVGNSNVVADCFGPLVGEILTKKYGIKKVFGNLSNNITSKNLLRTVEKIKILFPFSKIVVVDAGLANNNGVGMVNFLNCGCVPACFNNFKVVGDYSLIGFTNVTGISGKMFLKTVKFNMVLNMANFVANSISKSLNLVKKVSI